jgi:hypothetical protein
MNKQEIFDKVATHLLTQNKKSLSKNGCSYRGLDNTKCAIGCLIPDDKYTSSLEGHSLLNKLVMEVLTEELGILDGYDVGLLDILQCLHDYYSTDLWKEQLYRIAEKFKLNTSVLNKF